MAKEKERKFILSYMPDGIFAYTKIKQGYLMLEGKRQLRIRIQDGKRAILCYKDCLSSTERDEYEFEMNLEDANKLYESCQYKLDKVRYSIKKDGIQIDIDSYPDGTEVVELEYQDELKDEQIPAYCGDEITGVKEYSNIYLAKKFSEDENYNNRGRTSTNRE